ncbi:MAG: FAD-dependent thymidylate synthase [Candidatus Poseidoniales archaeon]
MNNNTVELIGHYGDDEVHACSAWTSTSREITDEKRNRIPQLLSFLAKEGHHTPFEKSSLHFLVDCDIASHIHLLKHRIGVSLNAESARYKELKEDKYILPDDWEDIKKSPPPIVPTDVHGNEFPLPREYWTGVLEEYTRKGNDLYHQCVADLEPVLGRKRAKESARFFKTYNSKITSDVMFNWRSFYHFQGLRNKPEAQKEIREIAQMMLDLVKMIPGNPFEHTIAAFEL